MPAGGLPVQISWGLPVLKVGVVGEDNKGVLSPSQIVPPVGKRFHHGKQLSFIDIIVPLCGGEGSRVICNGMEFGLSFFVRRGVPFALFLGEYRSNPVCQGIGLQIKPSFEVGLDEDRFSTHEGFEHLKCFELGFAPVP